MSETSLFVCAVLREKGAGVWLSQNLLHLTLHFQQAAAAELYEFGGAANLGCKGVDVRTRALDGAEQLLQLSECFVVAQCVVVHSVILCS